VFFLIAEMKSPPLMSTQPIRASVKATTLRLFSAA